MDKKGFNFDKEVKKIEADNSNEEVVEKIKIIENDKIGENQFYDIITSRKPDWQAIIYDLIHTEQLDPWDIDLIKLTEKYFERINKMEETDFYDSSKVLFAAALLLRIKSEFLLNKHIKSIDEVLFGKKDEDKKIFERIEINEDELPVLIPKTPLPRARKVTLPELMIALNKAINTESRRIKREVAIKRAQKLSEVDFPKFRRVDLKYRIKQIYAKVLTSIKRKSVNNKKDLNKVGFSELVGKEKEEKLACFLPILHLSNNKKLWLEQYEHLEEIWIYLHEYFKKNRDKFVEGLEEDIKEMKRELREKTDESISKFADLDSSVLVNNVSNSAKGIINTLKQEIKNINQEESIEKITGFSDE